MKLSHRTTVDIISRGNQKTQEGNEGRENDSDCVGDYFGQCYEKQLHLCAFRGTHWGKHGFSELLSHGTN